MSTITPSSIQYISQMLSEPNGISAADTESIEALKDAYPYFVPARYMGAARLQKEQAGTPAMMNQMQLYMGNWLLFSKYLAAARGDTGHEIAEEYVAVPAEQELQAEIPVAETIEEESDIEEYVVETPVGPHPVEEVVAVPEVEDEPSVDNFSIEHINFSEESVVPENDETLILPIYTEDYFFHQGIQVSNDIPGDVEELNKRQAEEDKSLMVVMSFSEWLIHFKTNNEKEQEEKADQKALKTMWQKEKLAAAMEEENEEIPENVFEMAVNSITKEEDLASEALADIYIKQGKYDKAMEMYRKLSLRNPQKNAYFARKIEEILKARQS